MPRILLYEFLTSGGLWSPPLPPDEAHSLAREGRAMLTALAADFVAAGFQTIVMRDVRFREIPFSGCEVHDVNSVDAESELLGKLSADADATVVIAPEFDGLLADRCQRVTTSGGRLLGPSPEIVALAGDKHCTAEHLLKSGVAAPRGQVLGVGEPLPKDFIYPAVLKPRFGAGSQNMRLIADSRALGEGRRVGAEFRLEQFIPGVAVSAAVLCGPRELLPLLPCRQRLLDDGRFRYLGGALPLAPHFEQCAKQLALAAIRTLPNPVGYLGVDMVLGDDHCGREDVVIEINPRLTTSYIGLRAAARGNLAAAMWSIAHGESLGGIGLSFASDPLEFDADGAVRRC